MNRTVAIATCDRLPDGDPDDRLLVDALAALGCPARLVSWSAPGVDWSQFAATVIRSTWDYPVRRPEFLAWASAVPRLINPAAVIAGNSDKRYLAALADAGVPVVPTSFFEPGEPVRLPGAGEFVVKPSVGAGSRGAGRFDAAAAGMSARAREHARSLQDAGRTVMIQPYLAGVDAVGETALVFIDGEFSHAIAKAAMLSSDAAHPLHDEDLFVLESITARQPAPDELAVAEDVVKQLAGHLAEPLVYARIDLLPSADGPVVIEAELIEPSLFLGYSDAAADRLARAIAERTG